MLISNAGAQSALDSVQSNPTAQNFKSTVTEGEVSVMIPDQSELIILTEDSILNMANGIINLIEIGPVAQSVKNEYANTSNELRSLANARTRPSYTAETGQPLTREYPTMHLYDIL